MRRQVQVFVDRRLLAKGGGGRRAATQDRHPAAGHGFVKGILQGQNLAKSAWQRIPLQRRAGTAPLPGRHRVVSDCRFFTRGSRSVVEVDIAKREQIWQAVVGAVATRRE